MLSIITITRNDIDGLKRTIESTRALRATGEGIEQIVIDGSDDDGQSSAQAMYCVNEINLRYFKRDPKGISDAFNYGIANSKHQWLWFLNGGDELFRNLDLNLFTSLLKNVKADLLIFQIEQMQSKHIVPFPPSHLCFPPVKTWIPHPATLIDRSFFERIGLFNADYQIAMDYELWIRSSKCDVTVNMLSMPITSYDENGLSSTQTKAVFKEGMMVLQKNRQWLLAAWLNIGKAMLKQYRFFKTHSKDVN